MKVLTYPCTRTAIVEALDAAPTVRLGGVRLSIDYGNAHGSGDGRIWVLTEHSTDAPLDRFYTKGRAISELLELADREAFI
jgi:hypothetical protein